MNDDKIKTHWRNRINWKIITLIVIVILAGIGIAAIQEYMKNHTLRLTAAEKHIPVESERGKNLIGIAEKTLENEGIDTRYLLLENILDYSPNGAILKFSGTETFYNAKVYTNHNLTDKVTSAVFAADLNRYNIDTQSYGEIWEYGKNYTLDINNNVLGIIDNRSNKVKLKILNYSVIQNKNQTDAIASEINEKFEKAQREFHIDGEEPVVIIDAPNHTGNLKNTGELLLEVVYCESKVCAMRIEEKSEESESNGWVEFKITHRIKYFNTSEWPEERIN